MSTENTIRRQIISTSISMNAIGINRGTSGNVSARHHKGFLITPSGLSYDKTKPKDIVYIDEKVCRMVTMRLLPNGDFIMIFIKIGWTSAG